MNERPIPGLPPPRPIPIRERSSILFIGRGQVDMLDGAFVVVDENGIRTHIPIGGLACLMLEPGTRVSHAAVALAARAGTLLIWVGEAGVRLYAAGQPGGARADRLLLQARLALDDDLRLRVVRKMYALRFREEPPERRSVDQLRGIEGVRVRETYKLLAQRHAVAWDGRNYDPQEMVQRRSGQPLPVGGNRGALWRDRGGDPGRGLCAGDRLPAQRQAAELRL